MRLTVEEVRDIAQAFRDAANALSDYIHNKWEELEKAPATLQRLNEAERDLRTDAFNFRTRIVGLELDHLDGNLQHLLAATSKAKELLKDIKQVHDILKLATALVMLGGAITSQNPLAIAGAISDLAGVAKDLSKAATDS